MEVKAATKAKRRGVADKLMERETMRERRGAADGGQGRGVPLRGGSACDVYSQ
jgi:hypothetical protein